MEAVSARQAVHPQRVLDSRLHPQEEARDVGELLDGEDPFEPERLACYGGLYVRLRCCAQLRVLLGGALRGRRP